MDATLWYFIAIYEHLLATRDPKIARELFPVLVDIVEAHQRGTRYGIHVDSNDHLPVAGEPGVQLTWMDAKVGDWVVTPRAGKPVEINALWYNALRIMGELARRFRKQALAQKYVALAELVHGSFAHRFWFDQGGYLYDVVGGTEGDDASLRPNQLFAISLPFPVLDGDRARSVVDVCGRELYTPHGLRTLATTDSRYVGVYQGGHGSVTVLITRERSGRGSSVPSRRPTTRSTKTRSWHALS